jgi:NitT/TauT family transport system ATP-binding protein
VARLVARDVKKVFPPTRQGQDPVFALRNVTFEAEGHTFVTLVGPSGCGKSTFLNMVSGIDHPSAGTLEVFGRTAGDARIGYVFQDPRLLPWKTVLDNMVYVLDEGSAAERAERGRRFLDLVNLGSSAEMYPGQLSGGMQQRAAIARAFVFDPSILLMDEPFSALDEMNRDRQRLGLLEFWQSNRKTVLFVTHSVPEAIMLSDRIVVMAAHPGRVAEVIDVDLPRPRTEDAYATDQFRDLERVVRDALHGVMENTHV